MFEATHKLHCLRLLTINSICFNLCYFWQDESIFSSNYRRCFVLLPQDKFSLMSEYKIGDLVDYFVPFALAKDLFNSVDN